MGGGGREGGSSARPTTLCIVTVARPSLGARRGGVVLVNCRYPVENTHKPEGKLEVGEAIQGRSECVVRSYFFWYCVSLLLILYAYMVTTKMKMMTL